MPTINNLRSSARRVAVVDYGMSNLHSVMSALQRAAQDSPDDIVLAQDAQSLRVADRIVFPGQGAMPDCMSHLRDSGMGEALAEAARSKPLLGVCMGQQMLFGLSEEGNVSGMALLPGHIVRFAPPAARADHRLKVPHMGWNRVHFSARHSGHPLWQGIADGSYFYFVHSYHVRADDPELVAATSLHGVNFTCAIARDNIFATQFHPEKSAADGIRLYRNYLAWQV